MKILTYNLNSNTITTKRDVNKISMVILSQIEEDSHEYSFNETMIVLFMTLC